MSDGKSRGGRSRRPRQQDEGAQRSDSEESSRSEDASHPDESGSSEGDSADDSEGNKTQGEADRAKPRKKRWPMLFAGGVVLCLLLLGGLYLFLTRNEIETDDAYTDGRAVMIAPQVSGYVTRLEITDNEFVRKGRLLVQIDPRPYQAALDRAEANLLIARAQAEAATLDAQVARKNFPAQLDAARAQVEQARGQLFQARTDYRRQHQVAAAATTQQAVDQSTAQLQLAQGRVAEAEARVLQAEPIRQNIGQADQRAAQLAANVKQAQAQLDQARLNLGYTSIVAPQDGWVTRRNVEQGNYLQSGAQIMALVTTDVWITANYKETQLARMRPGQPVDIAVDAYPQLRLRGHVDSIQLGSGSRFTAFPAENATGNYVKIVQRVPVKILLDDDGKSPRLPLPIGLSVEPTVHVR